MGLMDKAKDLASENRDKIEEQAGNAIDGKLDGDKANKAKDAVNKGLDQALGKDEKKDDK